MNLNLYDIGFIFLAIGVAVYLDKTQRQPTMIRRVLAFVGLVVGVTVWAIVTVRALP